MLHVSAGPAHLIKTYCCGSSKHLSFGVQEMMDDSCLLHIYYFRVILSVHY